jgi:hypothetical protein
MLTALSIRLPSLKQEPRGLWNPLKLCNIRYIYTLARWKIKSGFTIFSKMGIFLTFSAIRVLPGGGTRRNGARVTGSLPHLRFFYMNMQKILIKRAALAVLCAVYRFQITGDPRQAAYDYASRLFLS